MYFFFINNNNIFVPDHNEHVHVIFETQINVTTLHILYNTIIHYKTQNITLKYVDIHPYNFIEYYKSQ